MLTPAYQQRLAIVWPRLDVAKVQKHADNITILYIPSSSCAGEIAVLWQQPGSATRCHRCTMLCTELRCKTAGWLQKRLAAVRLMCHSLANNRILVAY
jgi:hypothetical protein